MLFAVEGLYPRHRRWSQMDFFPIEAARQRSWLLVPPSNDAQPVVVTIPNLPDTGVIMLKCVGPRRLSRIDQFFPPPSDLFKENLGLYEGVRFRERLDPIVVRNCCKWT